MERMKELVALLREAAKSYYQESFEIMPNIEYDRLYDELLTLEKKYGTTISGSPTVNVGYEVLSDLPKEAHESRMLSLDKTKEVQTLREWLGLQKGLLSWKLDGLTIVLTYEDGILIKGVTRGNGDIGEVITANARVFENVPLNIPYKGRLVLRGEAIIKYSDFKKINETIDDIDSKYKNPRNLCSGSVRQLNNRITADRKVNFYVFSLVTAVGIDFKNSRMEQMKWLEAQGFDVVEHRVIDGRNQKLEEAHGALDNDDVALDNDDDLHRAVKYFSEKIKTYDLPSDGLVLTYDDIAYGQALGNTAKFPRDSIAFKWKDEIKETVLLEIEWSASRTGLINPVAIFEPVELEGTTVARASVHNISIVRELKLGIGDTISVYKANMIIPQIAENLTKSDTLLIPNTCPVCGGKAEIKKDADVEVLICVNPKCLAKQIKSFTHFVSRDAMNIDGLSEATIEKLIAKGLIKELADLFHVEKYKDAIVEMDGFGEKSYSNLIKSIDDGRHTTAARFLYSLGIPNIGVANAKVISKYCGHDFDRMRALAREELLDIQGIGGIMADGYAAYFGDSEKQIIVADLLKEISFENTKTNKAEKQIFEAMTFVITGSLNHFENRKALQEKIENLGGKVSGSVSSKTTYLINNDNLSNSSKNKSAKELGIPILTEEDIMAMMETV